MPPLRAYAFDILGSMAGIAAFTGLSLVGVGPVGWLVVIALLALLLGLSRGLTAWSFVSAAALVGCLFVLGGSTDLWSPYQRLTVLGEGWLGHRQRQRDPHQGFPMTDKPLGIFYPQIDKWYPDHPFDDTLIIGAGTRQRRGDGRCSAATACRRRRDRPVDPAARRRPTRGCTPTRIRA